MSEGLNVWKGSSGTWKAGDSAVENINEGRFLHGDRVSKIQRQNEILEDAAWQPQNMTNCHILRAKSSTYEWTTLLEFSPYLKPQ